METYTKCLLRNIKSKKYIGRGYDHTLKRMEFTKTMRSAIKFEDESEASEWLLNAPCSPNDPNNYEYVTITYELNEKEVIPHVRVPESTTEAVSG